MLSKSGEFDKTYTTLSGREFEMFGGTAGLHPTIEHILNDFEAVNYNFAITNLVRKTLIMLN